ncbi:hypothetical protein KC19_1G085400 [Ceratodon purpureus]|uniref:Secreted protein n=1 Tax=Ceratodon purpureus TaxID=3225 RepID=A0A8T0J2X0_CERPU|nr:hypothetical protein KC19_1G085400 [Ceratodon purpureus]
MVVVVVCAAWCCLLFAVGEVASECNVWGNFLVVLFGGVNFSGGGGLGAPTLFFAVGELLQAVDDFSLIEEWYRDTDVLLLSSPLCCLSVLF